MHTPTCCIHHVSDACPHLWSWVGTLGMRPCMRVWHLVKLLSVSLSPSLLVLLPGLSSHFPVLVSQSDHTLCVTTASQVTHT